MIPATMYRRLNEHIKWISEVDADKSHLIKELEKVLVMFDNDLAKLTKARMDGMTAKSFKGQVQEMKATRRRVIALLKYFKHEQKTKR